MRTHRRSSPGLTLAALLGIAAGCRAGQGSDALSARCLEALRIREPELVDIRLLAEESPSPTVRQIRFEALLGEEAGLRVADELACRFDEGDSWRLSGISLGGRAFSEGVVALVNSELLLRDLSRSPERLEGYAPPPEEEGAPEATAPAAAEPAAD